MKNNTLNKNEDFTVRESRKMDLILLIIFSLLFVFGMVTVNWNESRIVEYILGIIGLTLPSAFYWRNRLNLQKVAIKINKDGIYEYSTFITNWDNFFDAHITQKEITGSISDNFILVIEYYKEDGETLIEHEIYMSDSFDKSEEEIIAAIKFFSGGEDGPP